MPHPQLCKGRSTGCSRGWRRWWRGEALGVPLPRGLAVPGAAPRRRVPGRAAGRSGAVPQCPTAPGALLVLTAQSFLSQWHRDLSTKPGTGNFLPLLPLLRVRAKLLGICTAQLREIPFRRHRRFWEDPDRQRTGGLGGGCCSQGAPWAMPSAPCCKQRPEFVSKKNKIIKKNDTNQAIKMNE